MKTSVTKSFQAGDLRLRHTEPLAPHGPAPSRLPVVCPRAAQNYVHTTDHFPRAARGPRGDGASTEGRERRGNREETHLSSAFSSRGPTHVSQTGSDVTALLTWFEEFRWFVLCCQGERHTRADWRLGTGPRTPLEVPAVPAEWASQGVSSWPQPLPQRGRLSTMLFPHRPALTRGQPGASGTGSRSPWA